MNFYGRKTNSERYFNAAELLFVPYYFILFLMWIYPVLCSIINESVGCAKFYDIFHTIPNAPNHVNPFFKDKTLSYLKVPK